MFGDEDAGPATVEQEREAYDDTPADPYAIEPALLPSGVKVEFRSMATLTAANLRYLRGADDREGGMAFWQEVQVRAVELLVSAWTLTTESGRPVLPPRDAPKGKERGYLQAMSAFDLTALERHLKDPIDTLLEGPKDSEGE